MPVVSIKESSDELNPPVVISEAALPPPQATQSRQDKLALAIATCGVGYLPLAPGTWGSLVGVGIYLALSFFVYRLLPLQSGSVLGFPIDLLRLPLFVVLLLAMVVVISIMGARAATRVEKLSKRKDPGIVVIDEVAGQLLTFCLAPEPMAAKWVLLGFGLFRFFDIVKPYPARRFEAMRGGVGVIGDDLIAGWYAAIVLSAAIALSNLVV